MNRLQSVDKFLAHSEQLRSESQERFAGAGKGRAARLKYLDTHDVFEFSNLTTEGGLCNVKAGSRRGKSSRVREHEDELNVAELPMIVDTHKPLQKLSTNQEGAC